MSRLPPLGTAAGLRNPPAEEGFPLVGIVPSLVWGDPINAIAGAFRKHGELVRIRFGPMYFYLLNHPDFLRHVLQENRQNYTKSPSYDELRPLLGNGLLTSEGEFWLRQRRLVSPAFHRQKLAQLARTMTTAIQETLDRWEALHLHGRPFDVAAEFSRMTLDIVGRTLFSRSLAQDADAVGKALDFVLHYANDRTSRPFFRSPAWLPTPANRKAQACIQTLDEMVQRTISEHRKEAHESDLLSLLLAARDEKTGDGMTDKQLRDEAMTLILAGHETTASALSWCIALLSRHPLERQKLTNEALSVLAGKTPGFEDLPRLPYALQVFEETLRLYPPAWLFERQAIGNDELGGYDIPAGAIVAIMPYAMHRHPAYWENPEGFDPDRFRPERAADRPKFSYLPFGGGPRICIGNQFALMEAQLTLAMLSARFRLDLAPGFQPELDPTITLRPRTGIQVVLERAQATPKEA